jgi:hypothetical protein
MPVPQLKMEAGIHKIEFSTFLYKTNHCNIPKTMPTTIPMTGRSIRLLANRSRKTLKKNPMAVRGIHIQTFFNFILNTAHWPAPTRIPITARHIGISVVQLAPALKKTKKTVKPIIDPRAVARIQSVKGVVALESLFMVGFENGTRRSRLGT